MILSHKHKFIFIKTNKTAGTSVEIFLSNLCGPEDVITPISKKDEKLRESMNSRGPQNCYAKLSEYAFKDFLRLIFKGKKKLKFYNHMPASEIKRLIPEEIWNEYTKFAVVRHPLDRFMSFYHWHNRKEKPSYIDFLKNEKMKLFVSRGFEAYTINEELVVDRVIYFENLVPELESLLTELGIRDKVVLPRTKATTRKNKSDERKLSDEEIELLKSIVAPELKVLEYSLD